MQSGAECKKKIFSIPLNPKLTMEQFTKFYDEVAKYKDYIYDIYFTSRVPPFVQDAMGDVFDGNQASDLIHNAMIFQTQLGIPLSATFNNIECPPREDMLDMWIKNFRPLYDSGIRTVTLPHTIWLLSGKIQQEYPELFIKNTIFIFRKKISFFDLRIKKKLPKLSSVKQIEWKKLVLQDNYDFSIGIDGSKIVSENLKNAIEKMQLKGFVFSELDYEVVVDKLV